MPQPATHYWVTKIALADSDKSVFKDFFNEYKNYIALGTSAPDLFYFPLMPTVKTECNNFYWDDIADLIHHGRTYDLFCELLDEAKKLKSDKNTKNNGEKLLAFAIGFYCHVITDCIFHPYVYRSTGDDWATGAGSFLSNPEENIAEYKHKYQECLIDDGVKETYHLEFDEDDWACPEETNNELLDFTIADAFYSILKKMYPDCMPPEFHNPHDKNHPIQQAYNALLQTITLLFEGKKILSFQSDDFVEKIIGTKKFIYTNNFFDDTYPDCDELPPYSPHDLFNFSCAVTRRIYEVVQGFWNDATSKTAKEYFENEFTNYLNTGNWNLDTGIQCEFNNTQELHQGNEKMNEAHIDTLTNNYNIFSELYKNLFENNK